MTQPQKCAGPLALLNFIFQEKSNRVHKNSDTLFFFWIIWSKRTNECHPVLQNLDRNFGEEVLPWGVGMFRTGWEIRSEKGFVGIGSLIGQDWSLKGLTCLLCLFNQNLNQHPKQGADFAAQWLKIEFKNKIIGDKYLEYKSEGLD